MSSRMGKCQLCDAREINNFTLVGRKRIPKFFCDTCRKRLKNGDKIDVKAGTLKKICRELDGEAASAAARKLLFLRDPRSADALHAYVLQKNRVPARDAKLALAAMDDPRAEASWHDALELDPEWRKFALNQRSIDSVCDGIVVARSDPSNKRLEILTLVKDSRKSVILGQIADILNCQPDHLKKTFFHTQPWSQIPPEDTILRWDDNYHAEKSLSNRNMLASNFAGQNESKPTIYGMAVLSGFDRHTGTIRSVPLRQLEYDLGMQAYREAAGDVHAWRKERGL